MEQLNRIELKGNVGSIRVNDGTHGKKVARINIATNYLYKDGEGNPQVETTWHSIYAEEGNGITAEALTGIGRGYLVHVAGRLRDLRHLGPDGTERQAFEVVADKVEVLDDCKPRCPFCGSKEVYVRAYVHADTRQYYNGSADCEHAHCADCGTDFELTDWELN